MLYLNVPTTQCFSPWTNNSPSTLSGCSWHLLSSIVPPASEKALSGAVLAAGSPSSDCAINRVKMNATFTLPLVIFCHIYRPHPHGINVISVPITTVRPLILSPFSRYYRNFSNHYRGFTAVTADLPLSPSPCRFLVSSRRRYPRPRPMRFSGHDCGPIAPRSAAVGCRPSAVVAGGSAPEAPHPDVSGINKRRAGRRVIGFICHRHR